MRRFLVIALLLLCLPMVGEGQSLKYHPSSSGGGMAVADVSGPISIATATTSLEALRSWTIPANTFPSSTYAGFSSTCYSRAAANANSKIVRMYLGGIAGTNVLSETNTTSAQYFYQHITCTLDSANTLLCYGLRCIQSTCAASSITYTYNVANALAVTCAATTGTAAADITLTSHSNYWLTK